MPSEEMLKKLLDEFGEKQALIDEEMKVVVDQLQQLEARLNDCKQRLSTINGDRDKVLSMKTRYLEGDFVLAPAAGNWVHADNGDDSQKHVSPLASLSVPQHSSTTAAQASSVPPAKAAPSFANLAPLFGSSAGSAGRQAPDSTSATQASAELAAPPATAAFDHSTAADTPHQGSVNDYLSSVFGSNTGNIPSPDLEPPADSPPSSQSSWGFGGAGASEPDNLAAAPEIKVSSSSNFGGLNAILGARQSNQAAQQQSAGAQASAQSGQPEEAGQSPETAEGFGVLDRFKGDAADQQTQSAAEQEEQQKSAPPLQQQGSDAASEDAGTTVDLGAADNKDEHDDDTVRTINDALRGLFR